MAGEGPPPTTYSVKQSKFVVGGPSPAMTINGEIERNIVEGKPIMTAPRQKAPPGTCDSHFHIFGPYDRFPLADSRRYDPPPALVPEYLAMAESLGIERMVVVQASVSGTDNAVTLDAVRQFGLHRARGVAVVDASFTDGAFKTMHDQGIRGIRFNIATGGGTPEEQLSTIARRIAPLGWHIQVYADGDKLEEIAPVLAKLPVQVVIDHCGGVMSGLGWTAIQKPTRQMDLKADLHFLGQEFQTASSNENLVGTGLTETFKQTLPHKVVFTQAFTANPAWNYEQAFTASATAGLNIPVYKRFSMTMQTSDSFLNDPAPTYKKNSFQVVTGFSYSLK